MGDTVDVMRHTSGRRSEDASGTESWGNLNITWIKGTFVSLHIAIPSSKFIEPLQLIIVQNSIHFTTLSQLHLKITK